jgi:hypothetical protein
MNKDDYSDFDWDIQPDHVYDIEFRKRMIQEFKIDKDLVWAFFLRIEGSVQFASEMVAPSRQGPTDKVTRNSWVAVSSSAENLLRAIEDANEVLEYAIGDGLGWHLIEQDQAENPELDREPQSLDEMKEQEAFFNRHIATGNDIIDVLRRFSRLANAVTNELPPTKRGPKLDKELWCWVQSVRYAWEHDLGRQFTRDVDDTGEPISEAARFVAMATERTPYGKTKALNMMKKAIAQSRKLDFH